MAYTFTTSSFNTASANTTHNVPLPSPLTGRRCIIIINSVAATVTTPSGWTKLALVTTSGRITSAYYRDLDGSEGTTRSFTTSASVVISAVIITCAAGEAAAVAAEFGVAATGRDPPSLAPSWGAAANTLFIALECGGTAALNVTTYPTGYTDFQTSVNANGTRPILGTCGKVAKVASDNPATFTNTDTFTTSANTIAVKLNDLAVTIGPTTLLTNTQAFYGPKIKQTYKPSLFTNAQTFYAPTVTKRLGVTPPLHTNVQAFYGPSIKSAITAPFLTNTQAFYGPRINATVKVGARFDNTQAFYAPKIKTTVKLAALFTNTQAFYGPAVAQKIKAPLHTNVQVFYAPTIKSKITAPLHTNVQTFYGPRLNKTVKVTARFDNAQVFYGPSIVFTAIPGFIQPSRHDNAQTFYGPTVIYARTFVAPLHTNTQVFYGPTIKRGVTPSLHTNAQQFFGPRIAFTVKVGARVNNMQNIYPPSLHFAEIRGAPFHTNTQVFYAPTVRRGQKVVAPYFVNDQSFYGPTIIVEKFVEAPFHTNVQEFYGPIRVVVKTPLTVFPGLHVNAQQFFAPRVLFFRPPEPVEPPHGVPTIGAGWWDEALEAYRKRKKKKPLVWNIPSAAEVSDRAPPWNPVVVTRAQAVNRVRQSKAVDAYFRRLDAKRERAKREQQIEDTIINTVVNILKKD